MSEIGAWLDRHGLGQHAALFAAQDIDLAVLPALTDRDLKELGLSLGHRRRLLTAIAALTGHGTGAADRAGDAGNNECRPLTVLYCDFADSAELRDRLDADARRLAMRTFQDICAGAVARFQGLIATIEGDGVLAWFGYPRSHDDDAERAVHAALRIVGAAERLKAPDGSPLGVRVGVATGPVAVGDLLGPGEGRLRSDLGEIPVLATGLQAFGEPNSISISAATHAITGNSFEYRDLGSHAIAGLQEPVPVWRALGEKLPAGAIEATPNAQSTGLIGREAETTILLECWEDARRGVGQAVLIQGEAGIGKSQLAAMLIQRLQSEPHGIIRFQCSPRHIHSELHPVIDYLRQASGFAPDDSTEIRAGKLVEMTGIMAGSTPESTALLTALLSLPTGDLQSALPPTQELRKEKLLQVLTDRILASAADKPLLWLLEDVHWIDATTLELANRCIDRLRDVPILALVTARPDFKATWTGLPHTTFLPIGRLGRRDGAALITRLAGGKPLPAQVAEPIVGRGEGVPLLIEELARTVLESGLLHDDGDRYALNGPLPPTAIPGTLHDSLTARLDRLGEARDIAEVGAVLDREFTCDLLAAVTGREEARIRGELTRLITAELLTVQGARPEPGYVFRHALIQDTVYGCLPRERRQQLHARIAEVLERQFPRIAETEPEVLAHHLTEAGQVAAAIAYWRKAGERATRRQSNVEAAGHIGRALDLVGLLPESPERDLMELDLCVERSAPLIATRGYGAPECRNLFVRARALCDRIGTTPKLFAVLYGLWVNDFANGRMPAAMESAEQILQQAERIDDHTLAMVGHRIVGGTLVLRGRAAEALPHLQHALDCYDPVRHAPLTFLFGQNHQVATLIYVGLALGHLGFGDQARRMVRQAITEAEELSHFNTLAFALCYACLFHLMHRDWDDAEATSSRLIGLAQEKASAFWITLGQALLGSARVGLEATTDHVVEMRRAMGATRVMGWSLYSFVESLGAEALGAVGDSEGGLRHLDEAYGLVEVMDQRLLEAECLRVRAGLLKHIGAPPERVEAELERAVRTARDHGAKVHELRAAVDLARLRSAAGRREEALALLEPIYGWFTEGFEALDLKQAADLLGKLRPAATF
jgi:class 3 adenylate cyclase/tetratricopeptide (TPR) repeat protein